MYPTIFDNACAHSGATVSTSDQCLSPYGIWKYGKYSLKSSSVRSIGTGFGMGLKNGKSSNNGVADVASGDNPFIGRMNTYWAGKGLDRQGWGYDIVEAAFKGTALANGFNFATVGMDFRKQVIQKGKNNVVLKRNARKTFKSIRNTTNQGNFRKDQKRAAVKKAAAILTAQQKAAK